MASNGSIQTRSLSFSTESRELNPKLQLKNTVFIILYNPNADFPPLSDPLIQFYGYNIHN